MILPPLSFFCNKGFLCIFLIIVVPFRYSARNISDKCVRKEQVFETKVPDFNFCVALKHENIVLVFFDNSKEQRLVPKLGDISILLVFCSGKIKALQLVSLQRSAISFKWCHQESNRGHKDFQSFALPTEL